jgi:hypothetical protein
MEAFLRNGHQPEFYLVNSLRRCETTSGVLPARGRTSIGGKPSTRILRPHLPILAVAFAHEMSSNDPIPSPHRQFNVFAIEMPGETNSSPAGDSETPKLQRKIMIIGARATSAAQDRRQAIKCFFLTTYIPSSSPTPQQPIYPIRNNVFPIRWSAQDDERGEALQHRGSNGHGCRHVFAVRCSCKQWHASRPTIGFIFT